MKRTIFALLSLSLLTAMALPLRSNDPAVPTNGPTSQAPDFTLVDSYGTVHKLSDYNGKFVVLEWLNHGCPFVRKHYNSGNMQSLQKKYTAKGVIWLSIISSAPGKQGHCTPEEANEMTAVKNASPTAVLLDGQGVVGKLYGARTTPHMFVIDPERNFIYSGAIDDRPTTDVDDISGATNYVANALDEAMSGKPVTVAAKQPYGCPVKYAN